MRKKYEQLYVLTDLQGQLLTLNPATDEFTTTTHYGDLKIWDVQPYNDENTWFMGNSPRPKFGYRFKEVPRKHLAKFS
jgi:hypothetical protein